MNKVQLMGRLTRDPDIRYTQGDKPKCIARFTLAVDRRFKRDGEHGTDFISCVVFGKQAEHVEKYYHKGIKIAIVGRLQTGSYQNKDGQTVYTTDVIVEEQEFAESKPSGGDTHQPTNSQQQYQQPQAYAPPDNNGFVDMPGDGDLPF